MRRIGFELITLLLFRALLAFSTLPSAVLLLVFGPVAALELLFPSEEEKKRNHVSADYFLGIGADD